MLQHHPLSHIRLNPAPEAESAPPREGLSSRRRNAAKCGDIRRNATEPPRRPDLSAYSLSALRTASMARA